MKKIVLAFLVCWSYNGFAQTEAVSSTTVTVTQGGKDNFKKSEFVRTNFPYQSLGDWKPGMKFTAEPQKPGSYSSDIELVAYKNKRLTAPRLQQGDYQGKTFTFVGFESRRDDKCVDDNCSKTFLIFECDGIKYEYSSFFTLGSLREYSEVSVTTLVYMDEIEKCKELFKNKTLYVQDVEWNTDEEQRPVSRGKYLPVNITSYGVGTQDGPVRINFKVDGDDNEYYLNVRFSGINKASGQFGVDFDKVFTFDDPKANYPSITSEAWHAIQHKKVQVGMTKAECLLSWGKAQQSNTISQDGETVETWYYDTGKVLRLKNGVVEAIEK